MKQYLSLREQYPRFAYKGYEIEENESCLRITYRFETVGLSEFAPVWVFPKAEGDCHRWSKDRLIQDMIFSLGMVELVSYWKIACPPTVAVEAGWLNQDQIDWWKDLYFNGLGEFFYVNGIEEAEPNHFMNIRCAGQCKERHAAWGAEIDGNGKAAGISAVNSDSLASGGVLVPIGGGKDSAVTLELLRLAGKTIYAYIINPRGATIHTTEAAGLDAAHVISAKRTLDPNMLELNRQGYLNGHTPFSALVAFSGIIAARMHGLSMVALSNESSANESTVQGSTVNHQYSKSFKFEEDFHYYQTTYLRGSAYYFSLLRPLSEFQIARYFAGQKQYHGIFRSCNAGSRTDSWCGHCPKCLFVYLILSPFLTPREVMDIFGRNMLDDWYMKETLDQLIGIEEEKPFECVGSRDEINTAIVLTIKGLEEAGEALPRLLSYYKATDLYRTYEAKGDQYSSYYDGNNLVPDDLARLVRKYCADGL
ncbi:hypothetical protein ADH76_30640 [Enterocloster clostridioformis]|uniref:hypothetical protein n=1 Tax=Enterocloster clostridioformis TaxID=1531 RepID=UPI00080C662B|nr:hypothetical protein [Enterocloster clostridioformis]ANU47074.1 hypothetical protein A4V08_15960 [Lachnoclostridium sp. YL32]NDO32656.1 hypothetical protein [Enterocloster clostridioformis]OXE62917.1 hypothetical protein ADH76_30640 [Enterocloster clostridioformis]QQQ98214.1 hypothetical protein I5Q83_18615 [Enterocloster clostridioformis]